MGVLGCGAEYTVQVVEEIGTMNVLTGQAPYGALVGEITDFTSLVWDRRLDDISQAQITIPNDPDCCDDMLSNLHVVHHGLVIYRDGQRVWDGPITRLEYGRNEIVITASDIMWLLKKRLLSRDLCFAEVESDCNIGAGGIYYGVHSPEFVAARLIENALQYDGHGYQVQVLCESASRPEFSYVEFGGPVYDLIQKLASEFINFTVLGRLIVISCGGLTDGRGLARTEELTCDDFVNDVFKVIEDGDSLLTQDVQFLQNDDAVIIDGVEVLVRGIASSFPNGTVADPYYGRLQAIQNGNEALASTQTGDPRRILADAAQNVLTSSYPPPISLADEGMQFSPDAPVNINDLIPGVVIPVFADCVCRPIHQEFMLSKLTVTVDASGESIEPALITLGQDNEGTFQEDRSF